MDRAVLKMKEHDGDAESASSLPGVGCNGGETGSAAAWMPPVNGSTDQRRQQAIERGPDPSRSIDQHGTVGPPAAFCADMQRYHWSTLNAGYSFAHRRHVCNIAQVCAAFSAENDKEQA